MIDVVSVVKVLGCDGKMGEELAAFKVHIFSFIYGRIRFTGRALQVF